MQVAPCRAPRAIEYNLEVMKAHAHRWRGLSIGGAALFVGLGVLVFVVGLLPGDSSLYDEVMAHRTPDIITFFTWVNVFGSWKGDRAVSYRRMTAISFSRQAPRSASAGAAMSCSFMRP